MVTSNDIPLGAHPIDRAAHRRLDADWLEAAIHRTDVLIFLMQDGQPLLEGASSGRGALPNEVFDVAPRPLFWMGQEALELAGKARRVFLGEDRHGAPVFALDLPAAIEIEATPIAGAAGFEDMRMAAACLSPLEANLAATARSLFDWHRRHGFCANCGTPTEACEAGWKRRCPTCRAEHFPRTDPVAIMLATRNDHCLLGRGPSWPAGFMSCLAGYVEPGETIEQAAARELEEEAGIVADPAAARYLFCQPWPFPSSLMIGVILPAQTEEITVDPRELAEAHWFSRNEARLILARAHPDIHCPPPLAVAHHILKAWVAGA